MVVFSAWEIVLLGLLSAFGIAKGEFQIVEPRPPPIYPVEHSSANVTCVAYDDAGVLIPETIMFRRKDQYNNYINLTEDGNLYFTNRTEESGRKLFVTMHIRNVTMEHDSKKRSYWCYAYTVGYNNVVSYGFSINVIEKSKIPEVAISQVGIVEHGNSVKITCNMTERGSQQDAKLVNVSLIKNGVLISRANVSEDPLNSTILLGPVFLNNVGVNDGGTYTCVLEVLLKNKSPYKVTDSTLVGIAPWFGEKEVTKKEGEHATLDCSARGFPPVNVKWKYRRDENESIATCIDSSKDKRYNIEGNGLSDPYNLTIANLEMNHSGSYYCCLQSNCSTQIHEDRCQRFVLTVEAAFQIVEPRPAPIYPVEHSSAKVTCVAYDTVGDLEPETIMFRRKNQFNKYINLTEDGNLYFTGRAEESGRKLFGTMHIRNVTMEHDSTMGSYRCYAYSVGYNNVASYGFSINVIEKSKIPEVAISQVGIVEHGNSVKITCNMTERGSQQDAKLVNVSLTKNGVLISRANVSEDPLNSTILLGPVVLNSVGVNDGGTYTCLLEVLLKNKSPYKVTDSTLVRIAPWFEQGDKEVTKKKGEHATLDCSARGFPLNVEWKYRRDENEEMVTCIDFSKDKRYNIERDGIYDPYNLTIADLEMSHRGNYYCCLPSNCSTQIHEDRCQRFVLTVEASEEMSGTMALKSHDLFIVLAFSAVSFLFL